MTGIAFTVTNAGRAALVAAGTAGTLPITIATLGVSASALVPAPTATTLPGEVKRIPVRGGAAVSPDTIHLVVEDSTADSYELRSLALYLTNGTLFAIHGQAAALMSKSASSIFLLAADIKFADIPAASIAFGDTDFLYPPATETVQGVAEISTQAESDAGTDDKTIVTPKKNRASFLTWLAAALPIDIWRASNDGSGSGMDADLLDGQHGSWYADILARLGFAPVQQGGGVGQAANTVKIGWAGAAGLKATVDATDLGAFAFLGKDAAFRDLTATRGDGTGFIYLGAVGGARSLSYNGTAYNLAGAPLNINGGLAWTSGNDGAGSGLDADLLDGVHASSFARIDTSSGAAFAGPVSATEFATTGQVRAASGVTIGAATSGPYFYAEGNVANVRVGAPGSYSYLRIAPNSLSLNDAEVVRIISRVNGDSNGYRLYADGFRECWGITSFAADQTKTVNYPFTFTNWTHAYLEGGFNSIGQEENAPFVTATTTTGFTAMNAINGTVWVRWHAFGY